MLTSNGRRPYSNGNSLHKRLCRDFLLSEILKAHKSTSINVCTLPNTNYELENSLISHYTDTKLTLIERDVNIVNNIANYWAGEPQVNVYNGDFFDILGRLGQYYDFIWADLCCCLTSNIIEKTVKLLQSQDRPSLFACTFLRAREQKDVRELLQCNDLHKVRRELFPAYISKHTDYKLVARLQYNAQTWGSHMNTYLFTNH